jgi:hypothetical protein
MGKTRQETDFPFDLTVLSKSGILKKRWMEKVY